MPPRLSSRAQAHALRRDRGHRLHVPGRGASEARTPRTAPARSRSLAAATGQCRGRDRPARRRGAPLRAARRTRRNRPCRRRDPAKLEQDNVDHVRRGASRRRCVHPCPAILIDRGGERAIVNYRDGALAEGAPPPDPDKLVEDRGRRAGRQPLSGFLAARSRRAAKKRGKIVAARCRRSDTARPIRCSMPARMSSFPRMGCATPRRCRTSRPALNAIARRTPALPRRHRRRRTAVVARRARSATSRLSGRGGRHARRRRRLSWRLRAGAGRGPGFRTGACGSRPPPPRSNAPVLAASQAPRRGRKSRHSWPPGRKADSA